MHVWQTFLSLAHVWQISVFLKRMPLPGHQRKTVNGRVQIYEGYRNERQATSLAPFTSHWPGHQAECTYLALSTVLLLGLWCDRLPPQTVAKKVEHG